VIVIGTATGTATETEMEAIGTSLAIVTEIAIEAGAQGELSIGIVRETIGETAFGSGGGAEVAAGAEIETTIGTGTGTGIETGTAIVTGAGVGTGNADAIVVDAALALVPRSFQSAQIVITETISLYNVRTPESLMPRLF
jgi:hypothetical protein